MELETTDFCTQKTPAMHLATSIAEAILCDVACASALTMHQLIRVNLAAGREVILDGVCQNWAPAQRIFSFSIGFSKLKQ